MKKRNTRYSFREKPDTDKKGYGVGFAIRNALLSSIEPNIRGTETLWVMKLHTKSGFVHLICAYAPTPHAEDDNKNLFYSHLESRVCHKRNPIQQPNSPLKRTSMLTQAQTRRAGQYLLVQKVLEK